MEWFHCNHCFRRSGSKFAVSNCGHIFCEGCINPKQCNICGASCSYLPITDNMKAQEKVFFMDPAKLLQSRLEHINQIAAFQRSQKERVTEFYKQKNAELEKRLKDVTEQCHRQVSELKRENAELKRPLSQRRTSPSTGQIQATGSQRMSLPVAVTSPVTPRSGPRSHSGSAERRPRETPRFSFTTPPGSATSVSSHSSLHSLHDYEPRTPTSTPTRPEYHMPPSNIFQQHFLSNMALHSPRPRNGP